MTDDIETLRKFIIELADNLPNSAVKAAYKRLKAEADMSGCEITYEAVRASIIAALLDIGDDNDKDS